MPNLLSSLALFFCNSEMEDNTLAVIKVVKNNNYTIMSNYHLRDMNLSNKTRGLLATMLSLPPNWNFTIEGLSTICKDGVDSIRSQLQELEKYGYLVRMRYRNEKGHLKGTEFFIYEEPQQNKPIDEKPMLENPILVPPAQVKPTQDNLTQISKEIINKDKQNTDSTNYPSTKQDGLRESRRACEEKLKEKFEFDLLVENGWDANRLTEVIRIMANVFCSTKPFFVINGENIPRDDVIDRLLLIDENHISYAFEVVDEKKGEIYNIKDYYLSVLFNAPMTMDSYITEKLQRLGVI